MLKLSEVLAAANVLGSYQIHVQANTKPLPAGAKVITKGGERFARFKRKGKTIDAPLTPDGKVTLESPTWHVRYKGPDGSWQRQKGYTDKDATQALGTRLEKAVARGIEGLDSPYECTTAAPWWHTLPSSAPTSKRETPARNTSIGLSPVVPWSSRNAALSAFPTFPLPA